MILEYLYREPEKQSDKALFLIHGYGSSAEDLFQFADHLPEDHHIFSFQGPYALAEAQHAWYAIHFDEEQNKFNDLVQARTSLTHIKESIDHLSSVYQLSQKVIMGFSQGCILSMALAINHPNFFEAVIGLSGYLNKDLLQERTSFASRTRFFISHGKEDAVIPFKWAKDSLTFFEEQQLEVSWHEYSAGHTVCYDNFKDLLRFLNGPASAL